MPLKVRVKVPRELLILKIETNETRAGLPLSMETDLPDPFQDGVHLLFLESGRGQFYIFDLQRA
jgi:hypothetical protein